MSGALGHRSVRNTVGRGARTTLHLSVVTFVTFIALSVLAQLPTTVLGAIDSGYRNVWSAIYPQGWQFFTKDPDDEEATVYSVDDGKISSLSEFPNASLSNFLGFTRGQRAQGTELASLTQQASTWIDCETVDDDCLIAVAESGVPERVENPSSVPTICGTVIVSMTVPVPWEYRHDFNGWRLDDRAALLKVDCQ